jgi:hypothetical protein
MRRVGKRALRKREFILSGGIEMRHDAAEFICQLFASTR